MLAVMVVLPAGAAQSFQPTGPVAPPIALVVDLSAGQTLLAYNADRPFLPASMTKAMSALIAFDMIEAGKLDPAQEIIVDAGIARQWSGKGTTLNLRGGDRVTVNDLLHGVITASANDAAEVLAAQSGLSRDQWLAAMNARATALGMADSRFASPSGWPDGGRTQVTARDMVRLGRAIIEEYPALYARYFGKATMPWRGTTLSSRNPLIHLPGGDGIKTGHTSEAGYTFLGSASRDGRRLVIVIAGAKNDEYRAFVAQSLIQEGFNNWSSRPFLSAGQFVGTARVQNGDARQVRLVPARGWSLAVPRGTAPRVTTRIVYRGPLRAPIVRGSVVAGLEVRIDGLPPHDIPLVAAQPVGVAGPFDRIVNGLLGLFA